MDPQPEHLAPALEEAAIDTNRIDHVLFREQREPRRDPTEHLDLDDVVIEGEHPLLLIPRAVARRRVGVRVRRVVARTCGVAAAEMLRHVVMGRGAERA